VKTKSYNPTQQAISDAQDQVSYAQKVAMCDQDPTSTEISTRLMKISNELVDLMILAKNIP